MFLESNQTMGSYVINQIKNLVNLFFYLYKELDSWEGRFEP